MLPGRGYKSYLLRLRYSSCREILYRLRQELLTMRLRRLSHDKARLDAAIMLPSEDISIDHLELPDFSFNTDVAIVQKLFDGGCFTLNGDRQATQQFERTSIGKFYADITIDRTGPDIRMVWEPARLQHITVLLLYDLLKQPVAETIQGRVKSKEVIFQWIRENPFLTGPHYMSPMECGLRIPVFFYALKILDDLTPEQRREIIEAIYRHAWLVSKRRSLFSSLGNHTVCECIGLIFAGAVFSSLPTGRSWLDTGYALLSGELGHQVLDDGGPAEQSLAYHRFVLDLYWLAVGFLKKNKLYECEGFMPHLLRGEEFLDSFRDHSGHLPDIGDSDDGMAIAPGIETSIKVSKCQSVRVSECKTFPTAGYTVINNREIRFTFDHGPLGMPPLYNHGHADAMSVTLSVNGTFLIIDPGTYGYNGVPAYRKYFKGTRAHNTVNIDGEDQAVQETAFIWRHPYRAVLTEASRMHGGLLLKGTHDGYERLKHPVKHTREVFFTGENIFLIRDSFSGSGLHDFELNYHLHPEAVTAEQGDGWWSIDRNGTTAYLRLLDEARFHYSEGLEDPVFGWYSPSYGIRLRSGVLSCLKAGRSNEVAFVTALCMNEPSGVEEVAGRLFQVCKTG